jgi:hypothetical protein
MSTSRVGQSSEADQLKNGVEEVELRQLFTDHAPMLSQLCLCNEHQNDPCMFY